MRILYIDIDSLTPSHLGCYGYERATSPTIDAIAGEGVRCTNTYTSDAPCLPSRTAFYSGRLGIQTGVVGHGGTAAEPKREGKFRDFRDRFEGLGLAKQLQKAGLHTAMVSPFGQRHAAHWFYAGFNEIHNTGGGGMEDASQVQPIIEKWLDDHAGEDNWYLHVNYWDVHGPYRVPAEYGEPFKDTPLPKWLDDEARLKRDVAATGPHTAMDPGMYCDGHPDRYPRSLKRLQTMADLTHWMNGYDTAIRYVDDKIKLIVAKLKAAGVYEDTAIIISADHGENQGELAIYGEHATADHGTCNIPMIIKWPGGEVAKVDDALHYHLDLAPTLMDLLARDTPEIWDGQSYAGTLTPRLAAKQSGASPRLAGDAKHPPSSAPRDDLVISQCAHVCQRSVRWNNWLYIRTYHAGFHLFNQEMLFDLAADPHEQNDLAGDHPDLCREGTWRLANWHDQQMHKMARYASDITDPLWTVIHEGGPYHANLGGGGHPDFPGLEEYCVRLEQTNRADGAAKLRERYLAGSHT